VRKDKASTLDKLICLLDRFFLLGCCFKNGQGCEIDIAAAKENLLIAANLGSVGAALELGKLFEKSDSNRYFWLGKAAERKYGHVFLTKFVEVMCGAAVARPAVVFAIGRALKGNVDARTNLFLS
jgi:TPR repeat protein